MKQLQMTRGRINLRFLKHQSDARLQSHAPRSKANSTSTTSRMIAYQQPGNPTGQGVLAIHLLPTFILTTAPDIVTWTLEFKYTKALRSPSVHRTKTYAETKEIRPNLFWLCDNNRVRDFPKRQRKKMAIGAWWIGGDKEVFSQIQPRTNCLTKISRALRHRTLYQEVPASGTIILQNIG